jgi:hypothetical protein
MFILLMIFNLYNKIKSFLFYTNSSYLKKFNKKYIINQINLLNIKNTENNNYVYFYSILLDNKYCLKVGLTSRDLCNRFYRYLFVEHKNQQKDINTFRLLAVYNFETRQIAQAMETVFNVRLKKYKLSEHQHSRTEQYEFYKSWEIIKKYIINGLMFNIDGWVNPYIEKIDK